jgi:hypothetical protein
LSRAIRWCIDGPEGDTLSDQNTARNASYLRSPEVEETPVGERQVLYHRVHRKALVLNPTGSLVWRQLADDGTPGAIAASLCAAFPGLTEQQALEDTLSFLTELSQHDMVIAAG